MLQNWIKNTQSRIVHEKDTIVPSLVNLFDLTIQGLGLKPISSKVSPLDSNVLSPCRHLVLFPQRLTEPQLASDGYETLFNPPGYSIRMWAGGNLTWISKNPLRFGQDVSLTATMPTVTLKQTTRGEAVFTTLHRSISNVAGPSVIETRSLVYLPASTISDRSIKRSLVPDFTFTCTPTSISLFRFSSVTFNSHKIHYDQQYAKQEGYKSVLVHGPLSLTLLLDTFRMNMPNAILDSFEYSCTGPAYVDDTISFHGKLGEDQTCFLWGTNQNDSVVIKGTLRYHT